MKTDEMMELKPRNTRALLDGAIDGYDETSRFSHDKIEISALSLFGFYIDGGAHRRP